MHLTPQAQAVVGERVLTEPPIAEFNAYDDGKVSIGQSNVGLAVSTRTSEGVATR